MSTSKTKWTLVRDGRVGACMTGDQATAERWFRERVERARRYVDEMELPEAPPARLVRVDPTARAGDAVEDVEVTS